MEDMEEVYSNYLSIKNNIKIIDVLQDLYCYNSLLKITKINKKKLTNENINSINKQYKKYFNKNMENINELKGGSLKNYINIKGIGIRRVRLYKNGKRYVIIKGKKINL